MAVDAPALDVAQLLKVLGEPVRWRIVERLAVEDLCVCHLVDDLDLAQPLVSHHLKALRAAGVVTCQRWKQWMYYRLAPEVLSAIAEQLGTIASASASPGERRRPCT